MAAQTFRARDVLTQAECIPALDAAAPRAYKRPMMYAQAIIIRITCPAL
ncbi:hypothetical protein [Thalassococcus lentus]|uniref:Uncharacterized protein n=1 Tax=Thalassococcus lentus TaxID=1210524 RepID=A0ABT4XW45_9RHOB|nr:hypothetical protein [Thalassococcus lentus]MDA7426190.1 hypothetical protein [Thalassococcus lentus]